MYVISPHNSAGMVSLMWCRVGSCVGIQSVICPKTLCWQLALLAGATYLALRWPMIARFGSTSNTVYPSCTEEASKKPELVSPFFAACLEPFKLGKLYII
jgi:hypothetical protein